MCERRDQADHGSRNSQSDGHQIGVCERGPSGGPEETARHRFNLAAVSESIKRPRVDPQPDGFACSQQALMAGEDLAGLHKTSFADRHWINLTDIVQGRSFYPLRDPRAMPAENDERNLLNNGAEEVYSNVRWSGTHQNLSDSLERLQIAGASRRQGDSGLAVRLRHIFAFIVNNLRFRRGFWKSVFLGAIDWVPCQLASFPRRPCSHGPLSTTAPLGIPGTDTCIVGRQWPFWAEFRTLRTPVADTGGLSCVRANHRSWPPASRPGDQGSPQK